MKTEEALEVRRLEEWYLRRRFTEDNSVDIKRYASVDEDDNRKNISKFRLCGTPDLNVDLVSLIDRPEKLASLKRAASEHNPSKQDLTELLGNIGSIFQKSEGLEGRRQKMLRSKREASSKQFFDIEDVDAINTVVRRLDAMILESQGLIAKLKAERNQVLSSYDKNQISVKIKYQKSRQEFIKLQLVDLYRKILKSGRALV